MNRRNQILAGILVLQLALVAIVFWPRKAASVGSGKSLFPGLEADRIAKLTIQDGQGQSIQLLRQPNGWVLPEADDYPCQDSKVTPFLDKIVTLKADRLVAQTSGSHKQLKVAEGAFERLVEFEVADGTRHKLYLGTSAGAQSSHMRADEQNEVYISANLSTWDVSTTATAWVDPVYFSVPTEQVVASTLENKNGRFEFETDSTGTWTLKGLGVGEKVDSNGILSLIRHATSVLMLRPLGKQERAEYGLAQPSAVVTLQTRATDGSSKTYTLRVGAKDAQDNSYVVQSSESPYYVRVSEWTVQDLVEKARSGFLELPTPTPGPTVTP